MSENAKNNEQSQPIPLKALKYFNELTREVMESLGSDDPQYKEALRLHKEAFNASGTRQSDDSYRVEKERFLLPEALTLFERGLAGETNIALGIPHPCNFREAVAPNVAWDKGVSPELFKKHLATYIKTAREMGGIEWASGSAGLVR